MSPLPDIQEADRLKPLCYDPARDKFILYEELVAGAEHIVPLEGLTDEQVTRLVAERNRAGPDYTVQDFSGATRTRDQVTEDVLAGNEFGREHMEADLMHLSRLLNQIEEALEDPPRG
jgi:hypothetical protein